MCKKEVNSDMTVDRKVDTRSGRKIHIVPTPNNGKRARNW